MTERAPETAPGQAPGRASFIARNMALAPDGGGPDWLASLEHLWDGMPPEGQDAEEAGAQAAIDVFLAGNSVSAESIREALAAQEPGPAPAELGFAVRALNTTVIALGEIVRQVDTLVEPGPGADLLSGIAHAALSEIGTLAELSPCPGCESLRRQCSEIAGEVGILAGALTEIRDNDHPYGSYARDKARAALGVLHGLQSAWLGPAPEVPGVLAVTAAERDDLRQQCDKLRGHVDEVTDMMIRLGGPGEARRGREIRLDAGLPAIDQFSKPEGK